MKKLLLLILLPFIILPQESYVGELRIDLINYGGSFNVTFLLTSIGSRWDANYNLTEDYETATDVVSGDPYYAIFDHVLDPSNVNDTFAVGIYEISAIENGVEQAKFYCDWRTSDWSASLDVTFKYDVGNNHFKNAANTQIIDHSYQTLWDLTNNDLETSGLEEYWENCLVLIPSADNNPYLIWGPYPTELGVDHYNIYKKIGTGQFVLYDETGDFEYIDEEEEMIYGPLQANETEAYYKVDAIYPTEEEGMITSEYTNTVSTRVEGDPPDKRSYFQQDSDIKTFSLFQNYPNPFNPTTTISYSLPVSGLVLINVFDVLGREVAVLENEQKEAGTHTIEFDASNFSSGIYFYQIQTGKYSETRKLILQK